MKNKHFFRGLIFVLVFIWIYHPVSGRENFKISDLYKLKSISGPKFSGNGNELIFAVKSYDFEKFKSGSDIYLYSFKTDKTLQLTFGNGNNFDPFWSKDGKFIYFLSDRSGETSLWKMSRYGGESKSVLSFASGINSPLLTGKGDMIFGSSVYTDCMADEKCNSGYEKKINKGKIRANISDSLLFRHWTSYRRWKYNHLFLKRSGDGKVIPITTGKFDNPPFSLSADRGFDVSPSGKFICYVSKHDNNPATSTNTDIFLKRIGDNGTGVNITLKNSAADFHPRFSGNGKFIAFLRQSVPGYESDLIRLALYDVEKGVTKILSEKVDNWISGFQWSADSKSIYFYTPENGDYPVYSVDIGSGIVKKIVNVNTIKEFILGPAGKRAVFIRSSVGEPYELWSMNLEGKKSIKRLTFFNTEIEKRVDIRPAERIWIDGADGKKIQIFIVKPHNFSKKKKYPLIINIHGGPQMMWSDGFRGDWQIYPGAGYVVVFLNPHGSTGYGQKFTESISGDWNGKVIEDINKCAEFVKTIPYVDGNRIGAMGWSWGGYAIMWLEGHNDAGFKAFASMMGVYNLRAMFSSTEELWFPKWDLRGTPWQNPELYRTQSPSQYVKNFKTPCLVITGERDYRVPYTQSIQFFTDLQMMRVPSRIIIFKNDGHWPDYIKSMPLYYNAHLEWFHKYLGGDPAPYDSVKMIRNPESTLNNKK